MSFLVDLKAWTLDEFEAHLARHPRSVGAWAIRIVYHHTAVPGASWAPNGNPKQDYWDAGETGLTLEQIKQKRLKQIENIMAYYRDTLGWTRGPQLFVDDLFVYQMTPLDTPGIHAGEANRDSVGLEVVGNFTRVGWSDAVARNALGAGAAWLRWQAIPVNSTSVKGHRDYNKPECPGDAIDLDWVRSELAEINSPATPASLVPQPVPQASSERTTLNSSLLAAPRAELQALINAVLRRPTGGYNETDVRVILGWYYTSCLEVGLDPLFVVAQMVHETANMSSWWAARPQRNPAGLGVTGEPGKGLSFPSWKESIIAHTGRLLAYALPNGTPNAVQQARISAALRYRPLPDHLRGSAPTLRGLTGTWATDRQYAEKLIRVANTMQGA